MSCLGLVPLTFFLPYPSCPEKLELHPYPSYPLPGFLLSFRFLPRLPCKSPGGLSTHLWGLSLETTQVSQHGSEFGQLSPAGSPNRDTSAMPENSTQCHHRVTKGDPDQSMAATHGPPSLPPLPSRQRLPLTWPTLSRALHTSLQLCPQVSPEDEGACQSPWEPSLSCLPGGMTGANELEDIPPVGVCWGPGQVTLLSSAPWSSGPKHTPAPFLVRDMQGDRV